MKTYICEFKLSEDKSLNYRTVQLSYEFAQAAFGAYCAKNRFKPLRGWKWRIAGQKTYLN
jgi:hypothetical protein